MLEAISADKWSTKTFFCSVALVIKEQFKNKLHLKISDFSAGTHTDKLSKKHIYSGAFYVSVLRLKSSRAKRSLGNPNRRWSGQFWANYSPALPREIIIVITYSYVQYFRYKEFYYNIEVLLFV